MRGDEGEGGEGVGGGERGGVREEEVGKGEVGGAAAKPLEAGRTWAPPPRRLGRPWGAPSLLSWALVVPGPPVGHFLVSAGWLVGRWAGRVARRGRLRAGGPRRPLGSAGLGGRVAATWRALVAWHPPSPCPFRF
jgi:hypothetical protein